MALNYRPEPADASIHLGQNPYRAVCGSERMPDSTHREVLMVEVESSGRFLCVRFEALPATILILEYGSRRVVTRFCNDLAT